MSLFPEIFLLTGLAASGLIGLAASGLILYLDFENTNVAQAEFLANSEHKIIHAIGYDFFDGYSIHDRRPVDFSSEEFASKYESEVVTVKTISVDENHKVKVAK